MQTHIVFLSLSRFSFIFSRKTPTDMSTQQNCLRSIFSPDDVSILNGAWWIQSFLIHNSSSSLTIFLISFFFPHFSYQDSRHPVSDMHWRRYVISHKLGFLYAWCLRCGSMWPSAEAREPFWSLYVGTSYRRPSTDAFVRSRITTCVLGHSDLGRPDQTAHCVCTRQRKTYTKERRKHRNLIHKSNPNHEWSMMQWVHRSICLNVTVQALPASNFLFRKYEWRQRKSGMLNSPLCRCTRWAYSLRRRCCVWPPSTDREGSSGARMKKEVNEKWRIRKSSVHKFWIRFLLFLGSWRAQISEIPFFSAYFQFVSFNVAAVVGIVFTPNLHKFYTRLEWIIETEQQQKVLLHRQELCELTNVNFAVLIVVVSFEEARFQFV